MTTSKRYALLINDNRDNGSGTEPTEKDLRSRESPELLKTKVHLYSIAKIASLCVLGRVNQRAGLRPSTSLHRTVVDFVVSACLNRFERAFLVLVATI